MWQEGRGATLHTVELYSRTPEDPPLGRTKLSEYPRERRNSWSLTKVSVPRAKRVLVRNPPLNYKTFRDTPGTLLKSFSKEVRSLLKGLLPLGPSSWPSGLPLMSDTLSFTHTRTHTHTYSHSRNLGRLVSGPGRVFSKHYTQESYNPQFTIRFYEKSIQFLEILGLVFTCKRHHVTKLERRYQNYTSIWINLSLL